MSRAKLLNEGSQMRFNVCDSEFRAFQSSSIQFLLPKNKRQKNSLLQILILD